MTLPPNPKEIYEAIVENAIVAGKTPRHTAALNILCKSHGVWLGGVWKSGKGNVVVVFDTLGVPEPETAQWEAYRILGLGINWTYSMLGDEEPTHFGAWCPKCTRRFEFTRRDLRVQVSSRRPSWRLAF